MSAPAVQFAAVEHDAPAVATTLAETRVLRSIVVVFGVASVLFFLLLLESISTESAYLQSWWSPIAVGIDFGLPVLLAIMSWRMGLRLLRVMLGIYAVGFAVVVVSFVPAMTAESLPAELSPWPLGITAIGSVAAALVWRPVVTWVYLVLNIVAMVIVRDLAAAGAATVVAFQDGFYSLPFSAIFTAIAIVTMRNARAIDRAAAQAHAAASRAAGATARAAEQARLDAIVHDEIMTVLLYASTDVPELADSVQRQAVRALEQLERIGHDDTPEGLSPAAFEQRLRSAPLLGHRAVNFAVRSARERAVPPEVASAFIEATTEAVRNSLRHGRPGASLPSVDLTLTMLDDEIIVIVDDDGVGFDPATIPPHRLGIRVSIEGRLGVLPGAEVDIRSTTGAGTTVTLSWRQR